MARGRPRFSPVHGVLVVDKPSGPTSHDVVAWARRGLGTRVVGHSGTLDPLATGVLVLAVGEATKLVPYLTAEDKQYSAEFALGAETDTLDVTGAVTERSAVPSLERAAWQRLADGFLGAHPQQVPMVSAVRVQGERLHVRARRNEVIEAPTRTVVAHALHVVAVEARAVQAEIHCGKGFYVRSWGRDLARAAGTHAHLRALRRRASGRFSLADAIDARLLQQASRDPQAREQILERLVPLSTACARVLPVARVSQLAALDCYHGRPVALAQCTPTPAAGMVCLLDQDGAALALARRDEDQVRVVRGFRCTPGDRAAGAETMSSRAALAPTPIT